MADGSYDRLPPGVRCGCTNCQQIFVSDDVADYWDEGATPVCPHCGMDTVVMETADMEVTPKRLFAMRRTY